MIEMFGLEIGVFVLLQIQLVYVIYDGFNCFWGGVFEIGVFNMQYKFIVVVMGKKSGIESSMCIVNVQIVGWVWCEVSFDFYELVLCLIKMLIVGNVWWKLWVNILILWVDFLMLFLLECYGLLFLFINYVMVLVL